MCSVRLDQNCSLDTSLGKVMTYWVFNRMSLILPTFGHLHLSLKVPQTSLSWLSQIEALETLPNRIRGHQYALRSNESTS